MASTIKKASRTIIKIYQQDERAILGARRTAKVIETLAQKCKCSSLNNTENRHEFRPKRIGRVGDLTAKMDDHGGMRFSGSWREPFDFSFSYQSVLRGPYRFESNPYKPHVHDYDENLLFLGTDPNDLSQLGGEYMMCIGEEMERHVVTVPSIMHLPKGLPHCPLYITRVDKPLIFSMFHAFRPLGGAKKPPA